MPDISPPSPAALAAAAVAAGKAGDWVAAAGLWSDFCVMEPQHMGGLAQKILALGAAGEGARAEAEMAAAIARRPAAFELHAAAARLALTRQDWAAAEAGLQALRSGWPGRPEGYVEGATFLRGRGRLDEAEALLEDAVARFGDTAMLRAALAQIAEARQDWAEAARRWAAAAEAAPAAPNTQLAVLHMLLKLGRMAEVDRRLADLADRFPDSHEIHAFQAMRAEARNAPLEALAFWRQAAALAPARVVYDAHIADALRRLERYAEAETLLTEVIARHPGHIRLLTSHAQLAQARSDWTEARRRWQHVLALDPGNNGAGLQLGIVNYQLNGLDADALSDPARPIPTAIPVARPPDDGTDEARHTARREMFLQMESLGDNCEFGLVQRRFGAEPLGLFRWTVTSIRSLIDALDKDLEGVGLPANTELSLRAGDEYYTSDTRFGMRMHTFIHLRQAEPDALLGKLCRRLQYLRQKFLDDLAAGNQKLFVYKSLFGYQPGDIETLHRSLQRRGPNALLCVKRADDSHPDGTVEPVGDGLFIGYIKRFNDEGGSWTQVEFDSWARISTRAHALWRQGLPPGG